MLRQSINEFKGEIEAWSQRGPGWAIRAILKAYINVAQYQPFCGGSYMPLPKKLQNKKVIINIQKKRQPVLEMGAVCSIISTERWHECIKPSRYPTEDGLNFTGIDFPMPVSEISRLEKQNPFLAINVFGWETECVTVHRLSEKEGSILRINLMLIQDNEKPHYTFVRRLSVLLHNQSKHGGVKHFCERCLHRYSRKELLERQTQMHGAAEETHKDIIVKSDSQMHSPYVYRGKDVVYTFLTSLQYHEKVMRAELANKKLLMITSKNWRKHKSATKCHICNVSLVKAEFQDLIDV